MNFGKILKLLLEENNLSQVDLARSIGYTQRAVSKWVNEQSEPSESAIKKTADFFEVSTDFLLGLSEDEFSKSNHSPAPPQISYNEKKLLDNFRAMRPDLQAYFLKMSETLVPTPKSIAEDIQKRKN